MIGDSEYTLEWTGPISVKFKPLKSLSLFLFLGLIGIIVNFIVRGILCIAMGFLLTLAVNQISRQDLLFHTWQDYLALGFVMLVIKLTFGKE